MSVELQENPIVATRSGSVRGKKAETMYGYTYYYFDGIPYAKPPLGEFRFRDSEAIPKWDGIKDCSHSRSKCLQWNKTVKEVQGSEDCLYLNVNVKKFNTTLPMPVMVYIHGGGSNVGDPSRNAWGPDYFMMKEVVFITICYRLGMLGNMPHKDVKNSQYKLSVSLGFAAFSDKAVGAPGNCGIKDILLALKWIKANCVYFNGDCQNITLFGHSSGSSIVHMIMQAPCSRGLFHKAILMAGFNMTLPTEPRLEYRLAKHLGFKGEEDDQVAIYEFLSQTDASVLVNYDIFTENEKQRYLNIKAHPCWPTMESYESENTIISEDPVMAQRSTWTNDIPIMMGCTSCEGLSNINLFRDSEERLVHFRKNPKSMLPPRRRSIEDEELLAAMGKRFKQLHFGDRELCCDNYMCGVELMSYHTYHEQHRLIQSRRKYASGATYVYRFDFDSPTYNFYRIRYCGPEVRGTNHVDELCYLFKLPKSYKLEANSPEYKCILQMINIFCAFAKSSNPSTSQMQWQPIEREGVPKCLNISYDSVMMIDMPEYAKCCVRDEIMNMANIPLY